jgi:hypothetical protein
MILDTIVPEVHSPQTAPEPVSWSRPTLIAFRFGFTLALLSLFHLISFPSNYLYFDTVRKSFDRWVGPVASIEARVVRAIGAFVIRLFTGSTGTAEEIAQRYRYALCYLIAVLVVAAIATIVWSVVDRRRTAYPLLNRWLRVYARYTLALVMMVYALVKVVPTQFGFLTPAELLRPVGQLTRFWVLWDFMAVSTGYTIFTGLIELLGCLLLFFRRTTLLGALLLIGALVNVFAMDLAYNVFGAAMVAGLLIALAMVVIAPYAAPLFNVLVLGRTASMPDEPVTVPARWRYATLAKALLLVLLVSARVSDGLAQRRSYFGRAHAVYGMFDVSRFVRGGVPITPLADDAITWKRVASDGRYDGNSLAVQFANGDLRRYQLADDAAGQLWTLREGKKVMATLKYAIAPDGTVSLDGSIGADPVQLNLRPVDMQKLPLLRR